MVNSFWIHSFGTSKLGNLNFYFLVLNSRLKLSGWGRKAQQVCGLQMVPIPHDPLALPYSNKSDPLRGPIFIPLNIKCLEENDRLFKGLLQ